MTGKETTTLSSELIQYDFVGTSNLKINVYKVSTVGI